MAIPVVESIGDLAIPSGPGQTVTPPLPSGWQQGNLLVALVGCGMGNSGATSDMACSGWTHVLTVHGTGSGHPKLGILYKIAGVAETAPTIYCETVETVSLRRARLLRISGFDPDNISGATPQSIMQLTSVTVRTHPSITTLVDDCLQISDVSWGTNDAIYTPPTGFTNLFTDNRFAGDSIARPTAGSTGTAEGSGSSSLYGIISWAIQPGTGEVNLTPSVDLTTPNESQFNTSTPTLKFRGSDPEADDLTYEIEITNNPDDFLAGSFIVDNLSTGSGGSFHPQPASTGLTWNGQIPVDDRMGQSYTSKGGILDKITLPIGDRRVETDGDVLVRVYEHEGTFGVSSAPKDATVPGDGPTPDWLAESEKVTLLGNDPLGGTEEFNFTGVDRIYVAPGTKLVLISDWLPDDRVDQNTFAWSGAVLNNGDDHPGNLYNDGYAPQYHGAQATWDLHFAVYEYFDLSAAASDLDLGFENIDTPLNEDPFISDDEIGYTPQSPLRDGVWYWRVRVSDPFGSGEWSLWTTARSFTINTEAVDIPAQFMQSNLGKSLFKERNL